MRHVIEMTYDKSTKNTHRYTSNSTMLTTIYVGKGAVGDPQPETITVTIESQLVRAHD